MCLVQSTLDVYEVLGKSRRTPHSKLLPSIKVLTQNNKSALCTSNLKPHKYQVHSLQQVPRSTLFPAKLKVGLVRDLNPGPLAP